MGTLLVPLVALVTFLALCSSGQSGLPGGIQELAGQPPWGTQGKSRRRRGIEEQAGQPPWGVKGKSRGRRGIEEQAGQPPWGVQGQSGLPGGIQELAGQPPWGTQGKSRGRRGIEEQAGQPPWGVKGKSGEPAEIEELAGQPPWGTQGKSRRRRGIEEQAGQPPWGVKGKSGEPAEKEKQAGQPPWGVKDSELKCDNTTLHEVRECRFPCPPQRTCQNFRGPEPPCVPPSQPCTNQCVCADGYARNKWGGTCVTLAQCDKCPGNNQYFSCDGPYSEGCTGSCHCAEGYERDANNTCVSTTPPPVATHPSPPPSPPPPIVLPSPPVEGPQPVTSGPGSKTLTCNNVTKHEIAACTYGCPPERTCQNRNWPPIPCARPPFPCTPKCICDNGYARNHYGGTCVTLEQCDKCPGNKQYFSCDGPYSEDCTGRCHCAEGYERDANNTCVSTTPPPVDTHPSPPPPPSPPIVLPSPPVEGPQPVTCGPRTLTCNNVTEHEIAACTYGCPPERTCQNRNWPPLPCAPPDFPCTPKCICDDGYARNQDGGTCVTLEQCDRCGENEYFQCDGDYDENCVGHCYCFSGYTRDINDKCVYVDPAMPPKDNGPPAPEPEALTCNNVTKHEIAACTYGCPPERTCQNRNWPPIPCAPPPFPCTPKCICDNGYARNQDGGTCVTLEQCDRCGENEYFQCDGDYDENCVGHCYCFSGYTRDINDKCVYVDPAMPPKDNGPPAPEPEALTCNNVTKHEIAACTYGCPPERTCQNRNWPPIPCAPPPFPCTPKCICDNGYARNQDGGTCVTLEQCDRCGENEYFQCDGDYDENCVGHCYCFSGYTRDINDKCVYVDPAMPPKDNGPPAPEPEALTCNNVTKHEIAACTYGCPPERTCQNRNWPPLPCAPPAFPCTPKCICDDGYARNQDGGTCVTLEQCDRCGENEYFQCDGDFDENCAGHCYCFSGYTRDINDKCVYVDPATPPKDNGPPAPEPEDLKCDSKTLHEVPACIYMCPPERTYQNFGLPQPPCQPSEPWECTPTCVCTVGYARNQIGGTCVTFAQCDKCPGVSQYFPCDGPYSENCTGACHCAAGYERDANNICVSTTPTPRPGVYYPPPLLGRPYSHPPRLLQFIADYMRNRCQYVRLAGFQSETYYTMSGVSQGTQYGCVMSDITILDIFFMGYNHI